MRTESQTRWEKGVDPELAGRGDVRVAVARRARGCALTGEADVRGEIPRPAVIPFRPARTGEVLGFDGAGGGTARAARAARLPVDGDWQAAVPTWRARDVRREIDVVEEAGASGSRTCR